ncbi:MAG: hypothetical protein Q9187_003764 [Circinaria calcarea]
MDVVNGFLGLCGTKGPAQHMTLQCFYERQPTKVGWMIDNEELPKEFMVDETSGTLPGRMNHGLTLDHFSLKKFPGPEDGNFIAVATVIKELIENAVDDATMIRKE